MKITAVLETIRTRLAIAEEAWHIGADKLANDEATGFARPRYVWVPTRDTFGPPERVGGNPKQLLTRFAGLELHLWADTIDDADDRVHAVIAAWMAEANTSVVFDAINWHSDSVIGRGVPVTLAMRVKVPVLAATLRTVRPNAVQFDASGAAQGDRNLDAGETT